MVTGCGVNRRVGNEEKYEKRNSDIGNGVEFLSLNERFAPVMALAYSGGEEGRAEVLRKMQAVPNRK